LSAERGERVITHFRTQKTSTLLAYLACSLHQNPPRERLIELLWPGVETEVGRSRFRPELSALRAVLEPVGTLSGSVLQADRLYVRLNASVVTTDVQAFEAAMRAVSQAQDTPERIEYLRHALTHYTGELLPGFYDDWALRERERLAMRYQEALRD